MLEREKTAETVEFIKNQRITLADVNGENLPPRPSAAEADATVEGVDVNGNGIRDDVELAIFERYPNSARIRAAMLQYAMGLQLELTQVFNSDTWKAAVIQSGRGSGCLFSTSPDVSLSDTEDVVRAAFAIGQSRIDEVQNLVLSTNQRKEKDDEITKYTTTYGGTNEQDCDVEI